jgi:hypothetical protein
MLKVVIVGDRGSGKATFLGFLYMTQVRTGSDKADGFRFHTPYDSLEALSFVFQQLMSGTFPDQVTKQGVRRITFELGFRRTGGFLSRLRGDRWMVEKTPGVHFYLMGTKGDEFSSVVAGTPIEEESWKDIYDSTVIVILVDCTKLAVPEEGKKTGPMAMYDAALASLLRLMKRRSEPEVRKQIYPLFVFSKFDQVNREVLTGAKIGDKPPSLEEAQSRANYAEVLLKPNLPRTLTMLRTRDRDAVPFATPAHFFSWVRLGAEPGKPERIQFGRTEGGGWEPRYSTEEYLGALTYLREIVSDGRNRPKLSRR